MNCPAHGDELVERLLWDKGKKVGRVMYCPHNGCEYQVKLPREERPGRRRMGQTAIDGGMK